MDKDSDSFLDGLLTKRKIWIELALAALIVGQAVALFSYSDVEIPSLVMCLSIALMAVVLVWFDIWTENKRAYAELDRFFSSTTATIKDLNTRIESFAKIYHQCIANEKYLDDKFHDLSEQHEKLQQTLNSQKRHHLEQLLLLERVLRISNTDISNDHDDLQKIVAEIEGLYSALAKNAKQSKTVSS